MYGWILTAREANKAEELYNRPQAGSCMGGSSLLEWLTSARNRNDKQGQHNPYLLVEFREEVIDTTLRGALAVLVRQILCRKSAEEISE